MENYLTVKIILEVVGSPKEHVEETLTQISDKLEKEEGIEIINKHVEEVKPFKKFFSSFIDLELKVINNNKLIAICFDYMPSSVEIIEPSKLQLESKDMTDILNDLLARLHKYDMIVRNMHAENIVLKRDINNKPKDSSSSNNP